MNPDNYPYNNPGHPSSDADWDPMSAHQYEDTSDTDTASVAPTIVSNDTINHGSVQSGYSASIAPTINYGDDNASTVASTYMGDGNSIFDTPFPTQTTGRDTRGTHGLGYAGAVPEVDYQSAIQNSDAGQSSSGLPPDFLASKLGEDRGELDRQYEEEERQRQLRYLNNESLRTGKYLYGNTNDVREYERQLQKEEDLQQALKESEADMERRRIQENYAMNTHHASGSKQDDSFMFEDKEEEGFDWDEQE
ncbi:hypothetical protein TREMEDRAFT_59527 [Tremella mesenterica DSM 1558]|uniref:uncharacterized protein n=1 Tax=Tremella mesenterica (strain ATCC 24925 / CBS 8224 / DSM 1558 / NBRC 9311 / NRRL Y-6157 / RJB 2259-6 / UBC 559-6) TaxID=578456 RepID=UPI0003F4A3A7|nr:uncharacterized protein TREMEDRAFT_59527 [Tremella mesenterica DSM 1558]EIW73362.1 hypothetical protein TREMEDRAFT_59527 [Tremella mesenterica DSM 1558]